MAAIDWQEIYAKLPYQRTDEQKEQRKKLFNQMDSGNGILSLAETDKGIRDVLKIDALFDAKPAIAAAFKLAKSCVKSKRGKAGDDYIEFLEFRYFLQTLRQYFEYYVAFSRADKSGDNRITLVEFKDAQEMIERWVGKIDAEVEFKKIDKNSGGYILFEEFAAWAVQKNLDLEDDDD